MTAFVDTHLHLWDIQSFRYPWLEDPGGEQFAFNYVLDDWLADAADLDIVATVHVQAEMDHQLDPVIETAWLAGVRAGQSGRPTPTVCVGYSDLRQVDVEDVLDRHCEHAFFRGVRQELWYDKDSQRSDILTHNLLDDPAWARGLAHLIPRGLTFDLLVWPRQLDQAADVFKHLPELGVVLEHAGLPPADSDGRAVWRQAVTRFAREVPNASMKISALSFLSAGWNVDEIGAVVKEVIDIFGPGRCMLGSNFPVDRRAVSYRQLWADMEKWTAVLTAEEQHQIRVGNALRVYRIEQENLG